MLGRIRCANPIVGKIDFSAANRIFEIMIKYVRIYIHAAYSTLIQTLEALHRTDIQK